MKIEEIKNKVAFKEVLNNNGYDMSTLNDIIKLENRDNIHSYIVSDNENYKISVLGKKISKEDASILLDELKKTIELADYIDYMEIK